MLLNVQLLSLALVLLAPLDPMADPAELTVQIVPPMDPEGAFWRVVLRAQVPPEGPPGRRLSSAVADGLNVFEAVPAGPYSLEIRDGRKLVWEYRELDLSAGLHRLRIEQPMVLVSGSVVGADTERTVELTFDSQRDWRSRPVRIDADGRFALWLPTVLPTEGPAGDRTTISAWTVHAVDETGRPLTSVEGLVLDDPDGDHFVEIALHFEGLRAPRTRRIPPSSATRRHERSDSVGRASGLLERAAGRRGTGGANDADRIVDDPDERGIRRQTVGSTAVAAIAQHRLTAR
jgi:hypothetical protein